MSGNALKECPFCGEKAMLIEHEFYKLSNTYGVVCKGCKAQTKQFFDTPEAAKRAWNKRKGAD